MATVLRDNTGNIFLVVTLDQWRLIKTDMRKIHLDRSAQRSYRDTVVTVRDDNTIIRVETSQSRIFRSVCSSNHFHLFICVLVSAQSRKRLNRLDQSFRSCCIANFHTDLNESKLLRTDLSQSPTFDQFCQYNQHHTDICNYTSLN